MSEPSSDPATSRILNLALLGYGKMGHVVERLARERGFEVRLILDIDSNPDGRAITEKNFQGIDVCIEFTMPSAVLDNIRRVAALGVNLVIGTTGWYDRLEEVREIVTANGVGLVYAPNFSIGVMLFYRLARAAAEIFAPYKMYAPYIVESHHTAKKDAPSGTAIELKQRVQSFFPSGDIATSSVRAGFIPGTHELGFDSPADTVLVRHAARSRDGFAEGALYAARWVTDKKGLFSFDQVLQDNR